MSALWRKWSLLEMLGMKAAKKVVEQVISSKYRHYLKVTGYKFYADFCIWRVLIGLFV